MNEVIIDTTNDVTPVEEAFPATSEEPQPVVPKITHNAFRGNYSNGVSAAKGIPVKWDLGSGTNIAWKKEIPRPGHNSPIINGNHVFFTGADEQARELYCYDLTTGEQRWSLAATNIPGSPSVMPKVTEDTGLASSSVATDGNRVCAILLPVMWFVRIWMVNSYGLRIWGFRIIIMVSYPLSLFSAIRFHTIR